MSGKLEFYNSDSEASQNVTNDVLRGLLRNLTEVRNQRGAERISLPEGRDQQLKRMGEIDGLNIAIAAVKRRIR